MINCIFLDGGLYLTKVLEQCILPQSLKSQYADAVSNLYIVVVNTADPPLEF